MPTTSPSFSIRDAISDGWRVVLREPSTMLALTVLQLAVLSIGGGASRVTGPLAHFVAQVASAALAVGWWRVASRAQQGQPVSLTAVTELTAIELLRYFVTIAMLVVVVGLGLLLLVVPGVYVGARLLFAPLVVVEEGLDPVAAMRRSWDMTADVGAHVVALALALVAIDLLGALALGLGLLVTMPISLVAIVHVYRRIRDRAAISTAASAVVAS